MTASNVEAMGRRTRASRIACGVAAAGSCALAVVFVLFYAATRSLAGSPQSASSAVRLAQDWPAARMLWIVSLVAAVVASVWTGASLAPGRVGRAARRSAVCGAMATAMVALSLWITPAKFYTLGSSLVPDPAPGHDYLAAGMLAGGAALLFVAAAVSTSTL